MRVIVAVLLTGIAAYAAELDARLLRLIGEDARIVIGVDHRRAEPFAMGRELAKGDVLLEIVYTTGDLRVIRGAPPAVRPCANATVSDFPDDCIAPLTETMYVEGFRDLVLAARERWFAQEPRITAFAEHARDISESHDAWFVAQRPLELIARQADPGVLAKFGPGTIGVIQEVRGGLRFGPIHDIVIEVVSDSVENAQALAALARWLPGFIQLSEPHSLFAELVGLAEAFASTCMGPPLVFRAC